MVQAPHLVGSTNKNIKMQQHLHRHRILCSTDKAAWRTPKIWVQYILIEGSWLEMLC